jgi:hypothetical protein
MLTLEEIIEKLLTTQDPDAIIMLLNLSTEDLLDKFDYRVEELYEKLNEELCDEFD